MPRVTANLKSFTPRHGKIKITFALMFMKGKGYEYSRTGNPTRGAFELQVAAVEGAKYAVAFSSGVG